MHSTDDKDRSLAYRDQGMADTTVWWYRHMRSKILMTAHNAHVGTTGLDPGHTIRRQGALLRDTLGRDYVPIGLTFSRGSLYAHPAGGRTDTIERFSTGPPPPDDVEYVLDQVRFPDCYLDLRTVGPPARDLLDRRRRVRSIGAEYPEAEDLISLPRTYDVLIHIRRITAARLLHSPDLRTLSPAPRPPASPSRPGGAPGAGDGWTAPRGDGPEAGAGRYPYVVDHELCAGGPGRRCAPAGPLRSALGPGLAGGGAGPSPDRWARTPAADARTHQP